MIRTTGKLFNEFYDDNKFWPEDSFVDDYFVKVNGEELTEELHSNFKDDDEIIIDSGTVFLDNDIVKQLDKYFDEWQREKYPNNFSGAEMDVIFKLVKFGPCYVGDLPSKSGAADLVGRRLVVYVCGPHGDESWYAATPELIPVFKELFGVQRLHSSN